MQEAVDPDRLGEVIAVLEEVGKAHSREPHGFLPAIGTDPTRRRRGYASALLAHALEACDRLHKVASLEASNPANVALYKRFGFEVTGEIRLGSAPLITPLCRRAR